MQCTRAAQVPHSAAHSTVHVAIRPPWRAHDLGHHQGLPRAGRAAHCAPDTWPPARTARAADYPESRRAAHRMPARGRQGAQHALQAAQARRHTCAGSAGAAPGSAGGLGSPLGVVAPPAAAANACLPALLAPSRRRVPTARPGVPRAPSIGLRQPSLWSSSLKPVSHVGLR